MPEPTAAPAAPAAPAAAPVTPPAEGIKAGAPAAAERMYTVKIGGKEEQWPESKVIERAQKAEGAEAAMKNAAEYEKSFNNFVANAQDPEKLLALLQHPSLKYDDEKQEILVQKIMSSKSPRVINAVKKWIYDNEIAPSLMDPKEREISELKAFKAQQEKESADRKSKEDLTAKQIAVQKKFNEHRLAIGTAIKAEGLPEAEAIVARVARYALLQSRAGKPVDIKEAAARVKADLSKETESRFGSLTEDNILDHIPAGVAELINKAYLKRLKGTPPSGGTTPKKEDANAPSLKDALRDIGRGRKVYQD